MRKINNRALKMHQDYLNLSIFTKQVSAYAQGGGGTVGSQNPFLSGHLELSLRMTAMSRYA
jgi:hypothetical protein